MSKLVRICAVTPVDGFVVRLAFSDGTAKTVDLEPFLHGPIFEPIRSDVALFRSVKVDSAAGTIVWSNGADIDPDVLYKGLTPAWMEAPRESVR